MNKQYNAVLFVESPSKIKVYQNTLQNADIQNYKIRVFSTKGHLREVIIQKKFDTSRGSIKIEWKEKSHVSNIIKQLKEIKFCSEKKLFIATDADREGEAIGWHLLEILKKYFKYERVPYRVCCIELTKNKIVSAINKSIQMSETICESLINAYKARITIDLIIGINGSCLLWEKLFGCKSLGRVQSISIIKIFDLETIIRKFVPQTYYKLVVTALNNKNIQIDKIYFNNKLQKEFTNIEQINNVKKQLEQQTFEFLKTNVTYTNSLKIKPLDMCSLSTVANTKLGMKIKEMYNICQRLYDGSVSFEGKTTGVITYMRTDSTHISKEFVEQIKNYIVKNFGVNEYVEHVQTTDKKNITQEAHEAIRPTFLMQTREQYFDFINGLDRKEKKVYQYVLFRTLASFMRTITYENTEYFFQSKDLKYVFTVKCTKIKNEGYLAMLKYHDCEFCYDNNVCNNNIIDLQKILNSTINLQVNIQQHVTSPPERLTESKLIHELKKHNIGRPSTYSYIVETIKTRNYVQMINNKYYITDLGYLLCIFINIYLQKFINYNFTSEMEVSLDKIAQNTMCVKSVIKDFINKFNINIKNIEKISRTQILESIEKNIINEYVSQCEKCRNKISLKFFKQKPRICCCCGFMQPINKIGYSDEKNIPPTLDYSKSQQYIKKVRQNNYIKYKKFKN